MPEKSTCHPSERLPDCGSHLYFPKKFNLINTKEQKDNNEHMFTNHSCLFPGFLIILITRSENHTICWFSQPLLDQNPAILRICGNTIRHYINISELTPFSVSPPRRSRRISFTATSWRRRRVSASSGHLKSCPRISSTKQKAATPAPPGAASPSTPNSSRGFA
jgi:hypothetical protein